MNKPENCPFCGKDAIAFSESDSCDCFGNNVWRAYCGCHNDDCGIGVEMFHTGDDLCDERDEDEETCSGLMDLAIEKWNKRAEEFDRQKLIELADDIDARINTLKGKYMCCICVFKKECPGIYVGCYMSKTIREACGVI